MTDQDDDAIFSDEELDEIIDDIPSTILVREAAVEAEKLSWFTDVGGPLTAALRQTAQAYLDSLGFPHIDTARVENWEDAADLAENPNIDSDAWETEESLRIALVDDALAVISEEGLTVALNYLSAKTSAAVSASVQDLGAIWEVKDQSLLTAATGAAIQTTHLYALSKVAETDEDHPAQTKFALFRAGRWPISITGSTFNLF